MRSSVVLPAPFGPHRPTHSRSDTCHVTSSNRTRAPNDLVTAVSWIIETRARGRGHGRSAPARANALVYHTGKSRFAKGLGGL